MSDLTKENILDMFKNASISLCGDKLDDEEFEFYKNIIMNTTTYLEEKRRKGCRMNGKLMQ